MKTKDNLYVSTIAYSIYIATIPIYQALAVYNNNTITKYLGLGVIVIFLVESIIRGSSLFSSSNTIKYCIYMVAWSSLSILWSYNRTESLTSVISQISYVALFILTISRDWNKKEKGFIKNVYILCALYYSFLLIQGQILATRRRSTFIMASTGNTSDENYLGICLGIALFFLVDYLIVEIRLSRKLLFFVFFFVICAGILCTGSRGAIVVVAVGLFFYMIKKRKEGHGLKILVFPLVLILFFLSYMILSQYLSEAIVVRFSNEENIESFGWRLQNFWDYLKIPLLKLDILLFGVGKGYASGAYKAFYGNNWPPGTHNDITNVICSLGIIGLFFVFSIVKNVWKTVNDNNDVLGNSLIIVMIIAGLDIDLWQSHVWWMLLAMSIINLSSMNRFSQNSVNGDIK